MGSGASTLQAEDKIYVSKAIKQKYEEYQSAHNNGSSPPNHTELFAVIKNTYEEAIQYKASQTPTKPYSADTDNNSNNSSSTAPIISPSEKHRRATVTKAIVGSPNGGMGSANNSPFVDPVNRKRFDSTASTSSSRGQLSRGGSEKAPHFKPKLGQEDNIGMVNGGMSDYDEDEGDFTEFNLRQSFAGQMTTFSSKHPTTISSIEGPGKLLKAKTSAQLLSMVNDNVLEDQSKIANFISQLKAGEVPTKANSQFRQRRLTYSQQTVGSGGDSVATAAAIVAEETGIVMPMQAGEGKSNSGAVDSINNNNSSIGASSSNAAAAASSASSNKNNNNNNSSNSIPPPPAMLAVNSSPVRQASMRMGGANAKPRTTIFASSEIGVVQEKKPPFPIDIMGTYSCHGIEPSEDEEDGIHEKINQDRGCIVYPYNSSRTEALLMVLDGHGQEGDKVSEFVMRQIVVSLEKDPLLNTDPVQALKNAYVTTNTALLVTDIHYMTSGTTCVTIYVKDNKLYVANAGDSRAVLAKEEVVGAFMANNLTRDHKPDDPDEKARIEGQGGFVCPPHEEGLSSRVYLDPDYTMIGLAMSRSIGDHAVKAVGVTAEPEVKIFEMSSNDRFLIMASDGVWEFISSQEAVEIVQSCMHEGVPEACQELIETAASRWQEEEGDYRDDITAIVVRFPLPFTNVNGSLISAAAAVAGGGAAALGSITEDKET